MSTKPHPLEGIFDIEPGSTPVFHDIHGGTGLPTNERSSQLLDPTSGEVVERKVDATIDELEIEERLEDLHIDGQLETIHSNAIIAFEKSSRMAEEVDPKFAARNAEVAAQYLNIALNAVNSRVDAKFKRQKVRMSKDISPKTVNNNVIIADRNSLLKQIFGTQDQNNIGDTIAGEKVNETS
jgi:hypothetical protein